MKYLKEHHDLAVVLVSHDLDYVARYSDQVILLDESVAASGTPKAVFTSEAFQNVFGGANYEFAKEIEA
jgi:zinc transport system ATP-binding protein